MSSSHPSVHFSQKQWGDWDGPSPLSLPRLPGLAGHRTSRWGPQMSIPLTSQDPIPQLLRRFSDLTPFGQGWGSPQGSPSVLGSSRIQTELLSLALSLVQGVEGQRSHGGRGKKPLFSWPETQSWGQRRRKQGQRGVNLWWSDRSEGSMINLCCLKG